MNGNPDHPKEMIFHIATGVTDIPSLFLTPNLYFTLSHCHCHTHFLFYLYSLLLQKEKAKAR